MDIHSNRLYDENNGRIAFNTNKLYFKDIFRNYISFQDLGLVKTIFIIVFHNILVDI
jgi:hypothetical protein